jgi:hypothetical protein
MFQRPLFGAVTVRTGPEAGWPKRERLARPGLRIVLSLELDLKPGMHVYAPGVLGYIPIDWRLDSGGPAAKRQVVRYSASEMLRLEAIQETVPVYRGHLQIVREITFGTGRRFEFSAQSIRRTDRKRFFPLSGM